MSAWCRRLFRGDQVKEDGGNRGRRGNLHLLGIVLGVPLVVRCALRPSADDVRPVGRRSSAAPREREGERGEHGRPFLPAAGGGGSRPPADSRRSAAPRERERERDGLFRVLWVLLGGGGESTRGRGPLPPRRERSRQRSEATPASTASRRGGGGGRPTAVGENTAVAKRRRAAGRRPPPQPPARTTAARPEAGPLLATDLRSNRRPRQLRGRYSGNSGAAAGERRAGGSDGCVVVTAGAR